MNSLSRRILTWALPCSLVLVAAVLLGSQAAQAQTTCGYAYNVAFYCQDVIPGCVGYVAYPAVYPCNGNDCGQFLKMGEYVDYVVCCNEENLNFYYDECPTQGDACCVFTRPEAQVRPARGVGQKNPAYADKGQGAPASPPVQDRAPLAIYIRSSCTGEYNLFLAPTPST